MHIVAGPPPSGGFTVGFKETATAAPLAGSDRNIAGRLWSFPRPEPEPDQARRNIGLGLAAAPVSEKARQMLAESVAWCVHKMLFITCSKNLSLVREHVLRLLGVFTTSSKRSLLE